MNNSLDLSMIEQRKQLMQQLLREKGLASTDRSDAIALLAKERKLDEPQQLSGAQRRLWFVQTLDPADTTLNICTSYRIRGNLSSIDLQKAFTDFFMRHEILRSTYHVGEDGEPVQVVAEKALIPWREENLTALKEQDAERRIQVLIRREFSQAFNLSVDLPIRILLIQLSPEEHILVLVIHHIAWDEESWPIFFAEISALYSGQPRNQKVVQYVDVINNKESSSDEVDLAYWRNELTPLPNRLDLFGAGKSDSTLAESCRQALPGELVHKATSFAREQGTTSFVVLLTAFNLLLKKYANTSDFLVSTPVVTRSIDQENVIGYFGNTVILRSSILNNKNFSEQVKSTHHIWSKAIEHQNIGIDKVIRSVNPERESGRDGLSGLVSVSFSARQSSLGFRLPELTVEELNFSALSAQEPLGLMIIFNTQSGYVEVEATYQTDVLSEGLVQQFLYHYLTILTLLLENPAQDTFAIDLLSGGEKSKILTVSHGQIIAETATTLVNMFERQCLETPDHLAIVSDQISLSYQQLNKRINKLAHWMMSKNVGLEDVVALLMPTSAEFVIAAIAVMKAGGAYLPVDPAYPAERIEYLLTDAKPCLTLSFEKFFAIESNAAEFSDSDPKVAVLPANLAYIIYTSGSTGKPKGVPVPHIAISSHISGFNSEWDIAENDRVLLSTSVSFDASLLDIFVTLTQGARVVIPKPNAYKDISYVADFITRHGVTVLHMVPSMLATFLMLPEANQWRDLRHVPVGGEALAGEVADRFYARFDAELRNHYGPTEAVVSSTHMVIDRPMGTQIVPIGKPNQNVYLYLLDSALQLVPTGVIGEIYLGGEQLARGYLHRPALSSERFIADPFCSAGRLYRTGDLARRNILGEIEFVGRSDEQVKIRGYRIELGEIESVVHQHPEVQHCVVVVEQDPVLGPVLAAYVVPQNSSLDLVALRAYLSQYLPDYMVPKAFGIIEQIPLTTHGKLDKRALPQPVAIEAREYREPGTATEARVASIFSALFTRDKIGADDSFFELGGHSLLAARLITIIRAEFGLDIDVRVPFDTPTVSGLAAHVVGKFSEEFGINLDQIDDSESSSQDRGSDKTESRPRMTKAERPEYIPLSYSQRAYWMQRKITGPVDGENVPFAIRFEGHLDRDALLVAISDVVARHKALTTIFPEQDGVPYQGQIDAQDITVSVENISAEELPKELERESRYIFSLDTEPLTRIRLFVLSENVHVLSLLMHHIIADQRSCQIFVEDLTVAFQDRVSGVVPGWKPLDCHFTDFAMWQRNIFDRPETGSVSRYGQQQLDYWSATLADLPSEMPIASDLPRPMVLGKSGLSAVRVIPAQIWKAATVFAEGFGLTEFMLCQAISATVINKLGGGEDLTIGVAVANRVAEMTDELLGLFANVIVLRNDLSQNPSLKTILMRTRESALGAISHQELPFERLVETLNPQRSLAHNPLFQVMMHVRKRPEPVAFSVDSAVTAMALPAQYDVSFMDFHLDYTIEPSGEVAARIVVNADLFTRDTGEIFADALVRVIEYFATGKDLQLDQLSVVDPVWVACHREIHKKTVRLDTRVIADSDLLTETEQILVEILEELLGISDISVQDNFFALGGDSVMSIQWAARAMQQGIALTPQLVFEHVTIAELASAVDELNLQEESVDDRSHAPMSTSGLSNDALEALKGSWASRDSKATDDL
ncbi:MAG: amino acid adenylation domain-containing protein [Mycobacteriaceae bacterium]